MKIRKISKTLMARMVCIQIALFAVLFGSYLFTIRYSEKTVRKNTIELNLVVMNQVQARLWEYREGLYNIASAFCQSPSVLRYISGDDGARVAEMEDMAAAFSNVLLQESNILSVSLYNTDMQYIANMGKSFEIPYTKRYMHSGMQLEAGYPGTLGGMQELCLELYYPVYDLSSPQYRKALGMCVFVAKPDACSDALQDAQVTKGSRLYLLHEEVGEIASSGNGEGLSYQELKEESGQFEIQEMELSLEGFRLVSAIPKQDFRADRNLGWMSGIVLSTAVLLFLLQVFYNYWRVFWPLAQIDAFVRSTQQFPQKRLHLQREDEIGSVAKSLDRMLDESQAMQESIQASQRKMYETELARQQAELVAYRSQVNPHFLYNTFACICEMAVCYDVEEIAELTRALSNVFRFAVKGGDMVTVAEEIRYVEEYAKIIHYRFQGKMRVEVEADSQVLGKQIPKLLLQPLVENAVFHGLGKKREGGIAEVEITQPRRGMLRFVVKDDGCGMEEGRLAVSGDRGFHRRPDSQGRDPALKTGRGVYRHPNAPVGWRGADAGSFRVGAFCEDGCSQRLCGI